jgi:tetratricopeptide (TPR) repeat protein
VGLFCFALTPVFARQSPLAVDTGSPEGKQMAAIEHETDPSKKQTMLEEFVTSFSKQPVSAWADTQLQTIYVQGKQYDKAIAAGQAALAVDPNNLEAAYNNLKAAEANNDFDGVAKWSSTTSDIARKVTQQAANPGDSGSQARLNYAKQVDTYTEYADYAAALKTNDSAKVIVLVESLEQRNPQSPYLPQAYGRYLNALRESGHSDKAGAAAERQLKRDPNSEDALLVAAGFNMQEKQDQKAASYAGKLIEVMQTKAKPDGMSDSDWDKKKSTTLGLGYWIEGVSCSNLHQYAAADKALKQALPLIKENQEVLGMALFHLGLADYQLGKSTKNRALIQQALKYSQQSAAIKSPLQTQAQNNVAAIKRAVGPSTHKP